jgi:hypothetical protein
MELKEFTHVWWHRRPIGIMWPTKQFSQLVIFWIPPGHGYLFILCLPPGQQRHGRGGRRGRSGRAAAGAAQAATIAEALRDLTRGRGLAPQDMARGASQGFDIPSPDKVYQNVASCSQTQDFPCDAFSKHKGGIWDRVGRRAVRADAGAKLMEKVRINFTDEVFLVGNLMDLTSKNLTKFGLS